MQISEINKEIENLNVFKEMTRSFQEIASQKMKNIRNSVLSSREYMEEVYKIFNTVRAAYVSKMDQYVKKRGEAITFLPHNGRNVIVLLSSNTGLYGSILKDALEELLSDYRQSNSEVTIIGRYGSKLFVSAEPNASFTYFDFPELDKDDPVINDIVDHIVQYESVKVYYPKFENMVKQVPASVSLSADIDATSLEPVKDGQLYIFEPELEKILMFFEAEIFASIFNQSISESQLAKSASRVMAMDKSAQNSDEMIKMLSLRKLQNKHRELNKKQLSKTFAVMYKNNFQTKHGAR